jgi:single-strand DNA-binding protein
MKNLKNSVRLVGFVGTDPEIVNFDSGKKKAKLVLATRETYKNAEGEKISETQWHNVIAWGGQASIIERYIQKGKEIMIEGKLASRKYEDKQGLTRYITEVVLNEIVMLGSPKSETA